MLCIVVSAGLFAHACTYSVLSCDALVRIYISLCTLHLLIIYVRNAARRLIGQRFCISVFSCTSNENYIYVAVCFSCAFLLHSTVVRLATSGFYSGFHAWREGNNVDHVTFLSLFSRLLPVPILSASLTALYRSSNGSVALSQRVQEEPCRPDLLWLGKLTTFLSELDEILTQCSSVCCVYNGPTDSLSRPYDVIAASEPNRLIDWCGHKQAVSVFFSHIYCFQLLIFQSTVISVTVTVNLNHVRNTNKEVKRAMCTKAAVTNT